MLKKQLGKTKNKRILITGGAGFIGSYLCERLVENNKITVFDNFRRNALHYTLIAQHKNLNLIKGDVLDEASLKKVVKGNDYIIHLAAIAGVSSYYKNPLQTLRVDAWGTYNVLNLAAFYHVEQAILFSTSEVYGSKASDVSEDSLTIQGSAIDSRWSYSVGKLIGDHFAFAFSKMKNLNVTIVRPFNIYGPRQIGEGAMQIFITQAIMGKKITIQGNGEQVRAWCYIDDFVDAVMQILGNKNAYNQIFNIGNASTQITTKNLAKKIIALCSSKSTLRFVPMPYAEVAQRFPNIKKASALLNYQPQISLDVGIEHTVAWYQRFAKTLESLRS